MNGNEFLDKMALIDPAYVEAADGMPNKKNIWAKWGTVAACLALIAGVVTMFLHMRYNYIDPNPGETILFDKTTAKISYGYDGNEGPLSKESLVFLTEEEMFAYEDMYIFRGKVIELTNMTIDFNGAKEYRCIATVVMDEVYQGELAVGDQISMLIPCAVDLTGSGMEDTGVIAQLEIGMEGIFMPWIYDENSYMERNGAVLIMQDLAPCGLADGTRWAFLQTEWRLVFFRSAYPGAKGATNLDEIEEYVMDMLR